MMTLSKISLAILMSATMVGGSAWVAARPGEGVSRPDGSSVAAPVPDGAVTGDYVEVRTAAVFAGACHYNGEYVTTGRDALMAWNFSSGAHAGASLAGIRVMAAVTSDKNLGDASKSRKAEIVIDSAATSEQANAVVALLKLKCGDSLGAVVTVRRSSIRFDRTEKGYRVSASDFGDVDVQPRPDDSCCTQPGDVWYEPLSPIKGRKVGYTQSAGFSGELAPAWHRSDENSAFYGKIDL